MLEDSKGQISVEFVMLIGLMLVLILPVISIFGQNNEVTTAMSAAREGVTNASNDLAYTEEGNVIRYNSMTFNNGNIRINVYSEFPLSSDNVTYIQTKALNNINNSLSVISSSDTMVQTKRYTYTVTIIPTS